MRPINEVCLDANVFVSSMVPNECDHEASFSLLKRVERVGIALFEPELVLFEVGSALHRKTMMGDLNEEHRDLLIEQFFRLPLLLQWQPSQTIRASALAKELTFKGISDACYLAVAQKRDIPLVTLDTDLIKKGRKTYRKVYSVGEFLSSYC